MKIGMLLISNATFGTEKVVYELLKNLVYKEDIYLFVNDEIAKYYKKIRGLRIVKLGKFSRNNKISLQLSIMRIRYNLKKFLKKDKVDIIHMHSDMPAIIYSNLINQFEIPLIFTFHGVDMRNFLDSKNLIYKNVLRPKIKKVFDNCSFLTSVGKWQTKRLDNYYKKKMIIIPNGVDTNIFVKLKIKNKSKKVLYVGRYVELKGIKEILNISKKLKHYDFWFAGQGPLENNINGNNIKNLGMKSPEELVKLYNRATICAFPSYYEAFGLVGLEAMACGKPVIATPLGFSEYIENGKDGIIIPAKNEKALKNAIVKLMENPKLREKLGKNARKKALKYSWDKVAEQYLKVFRKAIAKHKNN